MTALVAWIVVTVLTGIVVARVARLDHSAARVAPGTDLADQARKLESVLSSLSGFAFTSVVFIITLSGSRLQEQRTVDLIALLVVAYLGFVVAGIMYAHTEPLRSGEVDLLPALHAIASTQFYRSITQGWLALAPLIAILGIERLNFLILGLLLIAVWGAWIFQAANLTRLGYADVRFGLVTPMVGIGGAFAYAGLVQLLPQMRSTDAVLFLVWGGALLGANAHFLFHVSRTLGERVPAFAVRRLRALVVFDSHASDVLMAFIWLGVAGWI